MVHGLIALCAAVASISVVYDSVAATTLLLVIAGSAVFSNRTLVWMIYTVISVLVLCMQDTRTAGPHLITGLALLLEDNTREYVQAWRKTQA